MAEGTAAPGMGKPGTLERELWAAGCVQRDLAAGAEHQDVAPEWARSSMRDGAAAIQRLLARIAVLHGKEQP